MNPNNQPGPLPPSQPQQQANYDFITDPAKTPKRSLFSGGKNSLLIMVAGGLGILTLIILLFGVFFGGSSEKDVLLTVAQKQSQVIAVAKLGAKDGGTVQAQSLALAVQLSMETQQQDLIAQLSKTDKVGTKEYLSAPSSDVTATLETAQKNGRFDEAFNNAMKEELTEYQQVLQTANNNVSQTSTKELLASDFEGVGILLSIPTN